jgi:hypothetical protein
LIAQARPVLRFIARSAVNHKIVESPFNALAPASRCLAPLQEARACRGDDLQATPGRPEILARAQGTASDTEFSCARGSAEAVTCTDSTIIGDVGGASVVQTRCKISGAVIAPVSQPVVDAFERAYGDLKAVECTVENTFSQTSLGNYEFAPGVYCFNAAVTETNAVWTLKGGSNDTWLFKIGTNDPGALTGTGFSVVMDGGQACNVFWAPIGAASTMTDSNFKGTILAGDSALGAITLTRGTLAGRALANLAVTITGTSVIGCDTLSPDESCKPKKHHKHKGHDRDDDDDDGGKNKKNKWKHPLSR